MIRVEMLEDNPEFGLSAGDVLEVEAFAPDPREKVAVLRRVSDGYDPGCTLYRSEVRRVAQAPPVRGYMGLRPGEEP
jgi:hypothetical protein